MSMSSIIGEGPGNLNINSGTTCKERRCGIIFRFLSQIYSVNNRDILETRKLLIFNIL